MFIFVCIMCVCRPCWVILEIISRQLSFWTLLLISKVGNWNRILNTCIEGHSVIIIASTPSIWLECAYFAIDDAYFSTWEPFNMKWVRFMTSTSINWYYEPNSFYVKSHASSAIGQRNKMCKVEWFLRSLASMRMHQTNSH